MGEAISGKTSKLLAVGAGAACACLLATAVAAPQPADAASVVNKHLEGGKTYKAYDVTGDGVADTVKVKYSEPANDEDDDYEYKKVALSVNGEVLRTWEAADDDFYYNTPDTMKLMVTSDGSAYLLLYTDYSQSLYEFADGALKKVNIRNKALNKCFHRNVAEDLVKASGKNLRISYVVDTSAISYICFNVDYKVKNQKLVQVGTKSSSRWSCVSRKTLTLNYSTQVYKDTKCTKKASKLAKGSKIKTGYVVTNGSTGALQIKTSSGATRYLKVPKVWKKGKRMFVGDFGPGRG